MQLSGSQGGARSPLRAASANPRVLVHYGARGATRPITTCGNINVTPASAFRRASLFSMFPTIFSIPIVPALGLMSGDEAKKEPCPFLIYENKSHHSYPAGWHRRRVAAGLCSRLLHGLQPGRPAG